MHVELNKFKLQNNGAIIMIKQDTNDFFINTLFCFRHERPCILIQYEVDALSIDENSCTPLVSYLNNTISLHIFTYF